MVSQSCAAAYSRIPAARWVLRFSHTRTMGTQLNVSAHDQVAVVAPDEGVASFVPVLAVAARSVDQPGGFARPIAAHRGDRPATPGAPPDPNDRRVPASAPGAGARGCHREPSLVLEDDERSQRRRSHSTCGHTSFFHSSTACSSRSSARRAGLCQDQPCRCSSRQTAAIEQSIWNLTAITALIRATVHR